MSVEVRNLLGFNGRSTVVYQNRSVGSAGVVMLAYAWAGLSVDWGGEIGVGLQRQMAVMISLDDLSSGRIDDCQWCLLDALALTAGIGLGGGGGLNFLIGMNYKNVYQFADAGEKPEVDFSADLAFSGRLGKMIYSIPEYIELASIARQNSRNLLRFAELLKDAEHAKKLKKLSETVLHNIKPARQALGKDPSIISIPIAGVGLRVSIKAKWEARYIARTGVLGELRDLAA